MLTVFGAFSAKSSISKVPPRSIVNMAEYCLLASIRMGGATSHWVRLAGVGVSRGGGDCTAAAGGGGESPSVESVSPLPPQASAKDSSNDMVTNSVMFAWSPSILSLNLPFVRVIGARSSKPVLDV